MWSWAPLAASSFLIVFRKRKESGAAVKSSCEDVFMNLELFKTTSWFPSLKKQVPMCGRRWEPGSISQRAWSRHGRTTSPGCWRLIACGKEQDQVRLNEKPEFIAPIEISLNCYKVLLIGFLEIGCMCLPNFLCFYSENPLPFPLFSVASVWGFLLLFSLPQSPFCFRKPPAHSKFSRNTIIFCSQPSGLYFSFFLSITLPSLSLPSNNWIPSISLVPPHHPHPFPSSFRCLCSLWCFFSF